MLGAEPAPPRKGRKHALGIWHHNKPAKAGGVGGLCLQISGFGFTEEEKDDGLTMSVVSGEGTKSPANGDRVEAQAAQAERPPKPGECSDLFSPETLSRRDTVFVSAGGGGGDSREGPGTCQHLLQELQRGIFQYLTRAMGGRGSHSTEGAASRLQDVCSSISCAK